VPPKFVLFAHPRSGSSTLLRVLQSHPRLRVAEEPFHEKYQEWTPDEPKYVDLITDVASLEDQLAALFAKYDGIKVLDYQLPPEIYTHLLLMPELKVIFLRRRNLLQAAVSLFIAKQTDVWKVWDLKGDIASAYANLEPIALDELAEHLDYARELRECYGRVIARKPAGARLIVEYEDFYTDDVARNRESARRVFDFLGLEMPASDGLDSLLDPRTSKLNYTGLYANLPNAREIDARFGSDETGWLFEPR
jgi:hypothetical protein